MNDAISIIDNSVVTAIADEIVRHRDFLSEIDGVIGDGDHGSNMAKGFTIAKQRIRDADFKESLRLIGDTLFNEIGGSMGPLYGTMFMEMSEAIIGDRIDVNNLFRMFNAAVTSLQEVTTANVGDKTMMDVLIPVREVLKSSLQTNLSLLETLNRMADAAEKGRDSTISMVAKIGRASRLGERSRGVVDAGAASCCLIVVTMAKGIIKSISEEKGNL